MLYYNNFEMCLAKLHDHVTSHVATLLDFILFIIYLYSTNS